MRKVKIFGEYDYMALETAVNEFMAEGSMVIYSIHYTSVVRPLDVHQNTVVLHSALIEYAS